MKIKKKLTGMALLICSIVTAIFPFLTIDANAADKPEPIIYYISADGNVVDEPTKDGLKMTVYYTSEKKSNKIAAFEAVNSDGTVGYYEKDGNLYFPTSSQAANNIFKEQQINYVTVSGRLKPKTLRAAFRYYGISYIYLKGIDTSECIDFTDMFRYATLVDPEDIDWSNGPCDINKKGLAYNALPDGSIGKYPRFKSDADRDAFIAANPKMMGKANMRNANQYINQKDYYVGSNITSAIYVPEGFDKSVRLVDNSGNQRDSLYYLITKDKTLEKITFIPTALKEDAYISYNRTLGCLYDVNVTNIHKEIDLSETDFFNGKVEYESADLKKMLLDGVKISCTWAHATSDTDKTYSFETLSELEYDEKLTLSSKGGYINPYVCIETPKFLIRDGELEYRIGVQIKANGSNTCCYFIFPEVYTVTIKNSPFNIQTSFISGKQKISYKLNYNGPALVEGVMPSKDNFVVTKITETDEAVIEEPILDFELNGSTDVGINPWTVKIGSDEVTIELPFEEKSVVDENLESIDATYDGVIKQGCSIDYDRLSVNATIAKHYNDGTIETETRTLSSSDYSVLVDTNVAGESNIKVSVGDKTIEIPVTIEKDASFDAIRALSNQIEEIEKSINELSTVDSVKSQIDKLNDDIAILKTKLESNEASAEQNTDTILIELSNIAQQVYELKTKSTQQMQSSNHSNNDNVTIERVVEVRKDDANDKASVKMDELNKQIADLSKQIQILETNSSDPEVLTTIKQMHQMIELLQTQIEQLNLDKENTDKQLSIMSQQIHELTNTIQAINNSNNESGKDNVFDDSFMKAMIILNTISIMAFGVWSVVMAKKRK